MAPTEIIRCSVCGWPIANDPENGCVPGNCSYREVRHKVNQQSPPVLTGSSTMAMRIADLERENAELHRFQSAINLMLTGPNLTVRRLAERYLDGVDNIETFQKFLQEHPLAAEKDTAQPTIGEKLRGSWTR